MLFRDYLEILALERHTCSISLSELDVTLLLIK